MINNLVRKFAHKSPIIIESFVKTKEKKNVTLNEHVGFWATWQHQASSTSAN